MKDNDIISTEEMRKRILKIATGELTPSPKDPKIWYETKQIKEKLFKRK